MLENIENLKLLSVYEGISALSADFTDKPSHFLVCKICGESLYTFGTGRTIRTGPGDVIYIPKGSDYNVKKLSDGESKYIAVRFEAESLEQGCELHKFRMPAGTDMTPDFINMNSLWIYGTASKRMKCCSVLYGILSVLCEDTHEYAGHSARSIVSDCMAYLSEHIFDIDLTVEHLVERSGVSGTYFRRCFSAVHGVSPKSYITETRLKRARSIIEGGDFGTISEIARAVGFEDALYFGKAFKKRFGTAPRERIRRIL